MNRNEYDWWVPVESMHTCTESCTEAGWYSRHRLPHIDTCVQVRVYTRICADMYTHMHARTHARTYIHYRYMHVTWSESNSREAKYTLCLGRECRVTTCDRRDTGKSISLQTKQTNKHTHTDLLHITWPLSRFRQMRGLEWSVFLQHGHVAVYCLPNKAATTLGTKPLITRVLVQVVKEMRAKYKTWLICFQQVRHPCTRLLFGAFCLYANLRSQ